MRRAVALPCSGPGRVRTTVVGAPGGFEWSDRATERARTRACGRRGRSPEGGQGLVEFALALPIFILLLMSMIEYGFLYNNILTVQYAARQGVSAAAEAGANDGADCTILKAIETALTVPIDKIEDHLRRHLPVGFERRPGARRGEPLHPDGRPRLPRLGRPAVHPGRRRGLSADRTPRRDRRRAWTSSASRSATSTTGSPRSAPAGAGASRTGRPCAWSRKQ